jgi:SAM-dependent methyltransferase
LEVGLSRRAGACAAGIEPPLHDVPTTVRRHAPHLERLFDVFAQEARVGRAWLAPSLDRLAPGAAILEVGAGLMLLSCQLAKEGFAVTALEPLGEGFSSFSELQKIVLTHAQAQRIAPDILPVPVEQLEREGSFDFAYSVNVMEHVGDFRLALEAVGRAIRPGSEYRFTCANYLFPYEPHFDIPIVFSKLLTEKLFRRRIYGNGRVEDAAGVWNSLNWISVPKVARAVRTLPEVSVSFNRGMLEAVLLRVVNDPEFSSRRSPLIRSVTKCAVKLRLHRLVKWIPPFMQPVMDCSIKRRTPAHE